LNRNLSIGILILFIGMVLVGIGIYAISNIFTTTLQPLPPPTPIPPVTDKVLVMVHDVPIGYVIQADDVIQLSIPVELIPRNAMSEPEQVIGRMTKTPLISGETLLPHHLADPTNITHDKAFIIGNNMVLMGFPASDLMSGMNVLQDGDVVDFLVTLPYEIKVVETNDLGTVNQAANPDTYLSVLMTFDAIQKLRLTAIVVDVIYNDQQYAQPVISVSGSAESPPTPTPQPSQINVQGYLLALDPQDALVLKNLKDAGAIFDVVLRNPRSDTEFNLTPVTIDYLIERYNLPREVQGK